MRVLALFLLSIFFAAVLNIALAFSWLDPSTVEDTVKIESHCRGVVAKECSWDVEGGS